MPELTRKDGYRTLFTAEPRERIVSIAQFRGRLLVATDMRILEWNADEEYWRVIDIVRGQAPDEPDLLKIGELQARRDFRA